MKKIRLIAALLAVLCVLPLASCGKLSLDTDEAKDIINELLPKADEINIIFFGDGLLAVDEAYVETHDSTAYYEVSDTAVYSSVANLKAAAESVYSANYLESVYVSMFEGTYASGDDDSVATVSARYKDLNGVLKVDVSYTPYAIRHLASVKSLSVNTRTKEYISYDCVCLDTEGNEVETVIYLTKQNDLWRLDGPTY